MELSGYQRRLLATVLVGMLPSGVAVTILGLALPDVAADLGGRAGLLSWAITGSVLGQAIGTAVFGKVGDIHGHRKVYLTAIVALAVVTLGSALAWNEWSLIVFRVLAGAGSGAALAAGMAMILAEFPGPERFRVVGLFQAATTLAPAVGLIAGGPIVDAVGWRAIFFILTVTTVIGLVMAVVFLQPGERIEPYPVDVLGAVTLAVGVAALLIAIDFAVDRGLLEAWTLTVAAVAVLGLVGFVRIEASAARPLMPLHYFRRRRFIAPSVVMGFNNYAYMGGLIVTPLLLHNVFGYSFTGASMVLFMRPLVFAGCSAVGGPLAVSVGQRRIAVLGSASICVSMGLFVVGARAEQLGFVIVALLLSGVGQGISMPGLTTAAANAVDPADYGVTTGMRSLITQIGMTAGIQTMVIAAGGELTGDALSFSYVLGGAVALGAVILAAATLEREMPAAT